MAVKLRLKRFGRRNRAFYRLAAVDGQKAPKGRVIEELGTYDPVETDAEKQIAFKRERIEHWLNVGAQPSETVRGLLTRAGIELKAKQ